MEFMLKTIDKSVRQSLPAKFNKGKDVPFNELFKSLPGILRLIVKKKVKKTLGGRLRLMIVGAAAIKPETIEAFQLLGMTTCQGYGLTEIASVCCTNTNKDNRDGSIGKALRGVNIQIWDDDKNPLPDGEIGEIAISGPTVMSGYYTDGEESDDYGLYIDENGVKWVLSGDLGYKDDDGYYFFSGRKKRLILIAGHNVYPTDIEKALGELPYIKESCAVQGYNEAGKPLVRLYASLLENGDEEKYKEEICELCLKKFYKYYVPREIIFLDELPQTPVMKIDFMKLTKADPQKAKETRKVD
jgi:acyl-CoA synthetase (AMP-forming)/AMP-acid ligase II